MKFLNNCQKKFYQENGFVLLQNIFEENEFEEISAEYDNIFQANIFIIPT